MARPRKTLTGEQKAQIEAMAAFLTKEQIADFFGISRPTLNEIMKRDNEVSLRYKRGKASAIGSVAKSLLQQAREGNMTAAIFYLKTQAGWREVVNDTEEDAEANNEIIVKVVDARKDADTK